ncbi:hypothetical protein [Variovorax rhizosphaerae]|uniref:Carboxypeptidase regulatory-like domain-containing protein n=1 Tax=Variovorax rhizosphaerae TaxID=1836200 RepID=A0ABU8WEC9_9BURK
MPLPVTAATVPVNGTATYDYVPNNTGALDYASTTSKPIRGAVVEVLNSSKAVLATTTTDAKGGYSVSVPTNTSVFVRVKAQMLQTGSSATWDVSVRDNTRDNALYVMDSAEFSSGAAAMTQNLHAASGWGGASYTSTRAAAPFALLDTINTSMQKVLSVAPASAFPTLQVFWSPLNVSTSGNPAIGQIGTTAFSDATNPRSISVVGKDGADTDEYDASVIAHEWGHYYQAVFSRDDSPGGSHSGGDRLDRRVAFSEGWGDAWSGIALGRSNYTDSSGPGQAGSTSIDLTVGPATNPGWYSETSIQTILWNLNQKIGFQPIHATMIGGMKTNVAMTSIHSFSAAFGAASPGNLSTLNALLSAQNISAAANDPFGSAETNAGGVPAVPNVLPLYANANVGGTTQACVNNVAGYVNKLGSYVYLRVRLLAAGNHVITVTAPTNPNADPDFEVDSAGLLAVSDVVAPTETATVGMRAGDNIIVINDFNDYLQPRAQVTCFTVSIN